MGTHPKHDIDVTGAVWRRASDGDGPCVEVAELPGGHRAVRDSRHPDGPVLRFTPAEWAAFTAGVRDGEFD